MFAIRASVGIVLAEACTTITRRHSARAYDGGALGVARLTRPRRRRALDESADPPRRCALPIRSHNARRGPTGGSLESMRFQSEDSMNLKRAVILSASLALLPCVAGAQALVTERSLSLNAALEMASASLERCRADG